jgi:hypothetical protein
VSKHALRLLNHPEPANGDKGSVETAALRQEQALAPGGRLMLVLKSRAGVSAPASGDEQGRCAEAIASLCRHRVTPRGTASSATCAATEIALRAIDR